MPAVSATGISSDLAGKAAGGRKLIAVVYADMVGYSRLIGLDDAGTLRRLRTLRRALIDPAIREYGGRIVQTGGDSLLVAFDSIDGAVRCSVKVQQQVPVYDGDQPSDRRIRFRIGINIGDVIPDATDLHGDGVNIAARLEAECPVGGICVTRSVRDHVHGRLDLTFEADWPSDVEKHRTAGGSLCLAARSRRSDAVRRRQVWFCQDPRSQASRTLSSCIGHRHCFTACLRNSYRQLVVVARSHRRPEGTRGNINSRSYQTIAARRPRSCRATRRGASQCSTAVGRCVAA